MKGNEIGVERGGSRLRVRIPPGSDNGTRVRLAGQGRPGLRGGPAGDLYLRLRVRPHPFFVRAGDDLELDLPVTIPEAVLGAKVEVPTPDGPVTMTVPPRSKNGRMLRVRGKGVARRGGGSGDLRVRLVVQLPDTDDARLDEIARELEPLYGGVNPRGHLEGGS